ncbi:hypothetical protein D1007_42755 [Hordeum vulgare]|nr:hypothetical protein D1007_42755 [Hordeum vulgare]
MSAPPKFCVTMARRNADVAFLRLPVMAAKGRAAHASLRSCRSVAYALPSAAARSGAMSPRSSSAPPWYLTTRSPFSSGFDEMCHGIVTNGVSKLILLLCSNEVDLVSSNELILLISLDEVDLVISHELIILLSSDEVDLVSSDDLILLLSSDDEDLVTSAYEYFSSGKLILILQRAYSNR